MDLKKILQLLKRRSSISNFKKGVDEEEIYGPICIAFLIFVLFLLIFNIINMKSFLIVFLTLFYIFFFYYPLHRTNFDVLTFFILGGPTAILGIFLFCLGKITFKDVKVVSLFIWIYFGVSVVVTTLVSYRKSLIEADITLGFFYEKVGLWMVILLILIAPFALFFIAIGTTYILGKEYYFFWIPIFVFWGISGLRLFLYKILK